MNATFNFLKKSYRNGCGSDEVDPPIKNPFKKREQNSREFPRIFASFFLKSYFKRDVKVC